jgi:cytidylate kinase
MIIKGGFEKARVYIESHSKESQLTRKGPCITISREAGAGSDMVSEKLIEFFQQQTKDPNIKWTVFDRNLIEKILEDHKLPDRLKSFFTDEKRSKITQAMNELFGVTPPKGAILQKTSETILELANSGYSIIIGRAANIITAKLKNTFHVRLVSTLENRIIHIQAHYSIDRKAAIEFIKKEDEARKDYLYSNFHKQIDDPLLYNLVINTSKVTYEEAASIIGTHLMNKYPDMF